MDHAGLLNSMTAEQLVETCRRLRRSCGDMNLLLGEFEEERGLLRREQERLHHKIDKVTAQAERNSRDKNRFWKVLESLDQEYGVSGLRKAKEERQAAKRRKLTTGGLPKLGSATAEEDEEDNGPFSNASMQMTWNEDGLMVAPWQSRSAAKACNVGSLKDWVRDGLCAESVAEAEPLPDSAEMWAQQVAARAALAAEAEGVGLIGSPPVATSGSRSPPRRKSVTGILREAALGPGYRSEGEDATFGELVTSLLPDGLVHGSRPSTMSGQRAPETSLFGLVADWAANAGPAGAPPEEHWETLTVVLRRTGEGQRWGLGWQPKAFNHSRERIVDKLIGESMADKWNTSQQESGHPERCIRPGDQLVRANGKTNADDITVELQGQEVVLEFRRLVSTPAVVVLPGSPYPSSSQGAASGSQTQPEQTKVQTRSSFSAMLGHRMQAAGHAPVAAVPLPAQTQVPPAPVGAATLLREASTDTGLGADPALSKVPVGALAQVLSLQGGEVLLSWRFDWDAVAEETTSLEAQGADDAPVRRSFVVSYRHETDAQEVRLSTAKMRLSVCLDVGHRYTFEAHAVLTRVSSEGALAEAASPRPLWASGASAPFCADLRAGHGHGLGLAPRAAPATPSAGARGLGLAGASSPASGLHRAGEGAEAHAAEQEADSALADRQGGVARRLGVASRLGTFLAESKKTAAAPPPVAVPARPRPTLGPRTRSSEEPGRFEAAYPSSPLSMSRPRVVAAGPMDPASEKRDISGRLLIRRGGTLIAREEETLEQKLRSFGVDDDEEGELRRLSSALSAFEHHAARQGKVEAFGSSAQASGSAASAVGPSQVHVDAAGSMVANGSVPRLRVQLADGKEAVLECAGDGQALVRRVKDFVQSHKLRPEIVEEPLLERARGLLDAGLEEDTVDIIDLM